MKTLLFKSLLIVAVISLITLLSTCKKETECKAAITVKYYYDTLIVVPNAKVKISKYEVMQTGLTNGSGVYNATFELEAILEVYAEKDTTTIIHDPQLPLLTGAAVIRLKPGETIRKTVFIQ